MKFRFCEAGEHIFDFGEVGTEFFIMIKGKASVIVPNARRKNHVSAMQVEQQQQTLQKAEETAAAESENSCGESSSGSESGETSSGTASGCRMSHSSGGD